MQAGSYGAGPLEPGKSWGARSLGFQLPDGQYEFTVVLDFVNSIAEIDESNNRALLQVRIENGRIVNKSVTCPSSPKDLKADVRIESEKPDVLRVPSDRYPTIQSAVDAANKDDKIVLDPSTTKDHISEQSKPHVNTIMSNQYENRLPNGVRVELVGLFTGQSKEDLTWWRPDGTGISKQEYTLYEGKIRSENIRHLETWKFEYGYVLKFSPMDVRVLVDVTVGMQSAFGHPRNDGFSINYVESDKNQRKKGLPQIGDIRVAVAYGSFTPNGLNRGIGSVAGSYSPSFWDKLSYEIGIKNRRSMGSSYRVGLDTHSFSLDDGSTIILTSVRPDHFGPESGLLVDAIANANDLDINVIYESKEGKVNKADPHSLSGSSLISTIQKPKPMIQRTFRLRSIKQEDLKRIAVEYRRFKGVSFKDVALKPNVKTDVKIEAIGAFTAK